MEAFNKQKFKPRQRIWLILGGLVVLAILLYQIPPIHDRLSWRLDYAWIYIKGIFDPVEAVPTPVAQTQPAATATPSPTPSPTLPTPTVELSPTPQPSPTPLPVQVFLPSPKNELEDLNACGPATLAMYLRFYGWEGDQYTISEIVKPVRADRNVNVEELIYYSRNYTGWLNTEYRVGGNLTVLRQLIGAGIPVMIEGSFMLDKAFYPNDDKWAGHYQLVTGYDDSRQSFIVQDSEKGPDLWVTYDQLKLNWQSFNYVYILIYPPSQQEQVKAILGPDWDPEVNRENALALAQSEIDANANDAFAWFNLGTNLVYFDRYSDAARAYDQARTLGLPQRMLRYQFGPFIAYFNTLRNEDLLALADYSLERTPNSEEALLWRGWALYRLNRKAEALDSFNQALEEHPEYADAIYAVQYVQEH
ncbi:MAG TPA: C39 family peptidase [Anaerolineaceae bacterium]|nr:C39 family peptidase [Anaerolineaceae bacterium]